MTTVMSDDFREMIEANGPVERREETKCPICLKKVSVKGVPQHMLAKHGTIMARDQSHDDRIA